jgi:hypothetical protein
MKDKFQQVKATIGLRLLHQPMRKLCFSLSLSLSLSRLDDSENDCRTELHSDAVTSVKIESVRALAVRGRNKFAEKGKIMHVELIVGL